MLVRNFVRETVMLSLDIRVRVRIRVRVFVMLYMHFFHGRISDQSLVKGVMCFV